MAPYHSSYNGCSPLRVGLAPRDGDQLSHLSACLVDPLCAILEAIGYDGYVTIHQAFAGLRGPDEAAKRSAAYLRSLASFDDPLTCGGNDHEDR